MLSFPKYFLSNLVFENIFCELNTWNLTLFPPLVSSFIHICSQILLKSYSQLLLKNLDHNFCWKLVLLITYLLFAISFTTFLNFYSQLFFTNFATNFLHSFSLQLFFKLVKGCSQLLIKILLTTFVSSVLYPN